MEPIPGISVTLLKNTHWVVIATLVLVTAYWIYKGPEFRFNFNRMVADWFTDIVGYVMLVSFALLFVLPLWAWITSTLPFVAVLGTWLVGFTLLVLLNGMLTLWCSIHNMIASKVPMQFDVAKKPRKKLKVIYE